ncbi:MAG: hypothetical protein R6X06_03505 [Gammaproteobacteria bacterium]
MKYLDQLESMLDTGYRLVTIETYDPERVEELFTQLSRFSSRAYYMGSPGEGIHRVGASHIKIPRTQTSREMLIHIDKCKHFGVYILKEFNNEMEQESIVEQLKQIALGNADKVIILLGEFIDLPKSLKPFTLRSKHQMKQAV